MAESDYSGSGSWGGTTTGNSVFTDATDVYDSWQGKDIFSLESFSGQVYAAANAFKGLAANVFPDNPLQGLALLFGTTQIGRASCRERV